MNVCVIGGGAAGMVSAIRAAGAGHNVRILELRDRIGKKILATGNGKCNMSNADQSLSHYHGLEDEDASRRLVESIFEKFSQEDTLAFFEELGIETINRNGYIYPRSEQAASVLDVLRYKLEDLGVTISCDCSVREIIRDNKGFKIMTSQGLVNADRVIMACGSLASLQKASDDGYSLAKSLGHNVINPLPALVPIECKGNAFKSVAGVRTKGSIRIYDNNNKLLSEDTGELQLNSYGVSGIPAFMVSHIVSKYIAEGRKLFVSLDFMPEKSSDELKHMLYDRINRAPYKVAETFLIGLLNKNLALALVKESGIDFKMQVTGLSDINLDSLVSKIKDFRAEIIGTKSYKEAQICAGGVDVRELKDTLESRLVEGLYFAGEMVDVHGDCGGYNLQWAFSSGSVCGNLI